MKEIHSVGSHTQEVTCVCVCVRERERDIVTC